MPELLPQLESATKKTVSEDQFSNNSSENCPMTSCELQDGAKPSVEPLIPSGAVEAIVRACFSTEATFGPLEARNSLLHIYEELRELYLIGVDAGVNKPHDAVRLLLDTAAGSSEASSSTAAANSEAVRQLPILKAALFLLYHYLLWVATSQNTPCTSLL